MLIIRKNPSNIFQQNFVFIVYMFVLLSKICDGWHVGVHTAKSELAHHIMQGLFYEEDFQVNCSVPVCDGELAGIYCGGPILFASRYFGLRETCPGTRLTFPPEIVLQNFNNLKRPLNRTIFEEFCKANFQSDNYLKPASLTDWKQMPESFKLISHPKMKKFAIRLHNVWPKLSREFVEDVHNNRSRYPVLAVPHRFIVPGGHFQVYFYWDSYWIIKGLLFSELFETALGILRNFAIIIKERGFIPNSGNIELSRRSQPPLFVHMLYDYYTKITGQDMLNISKKFLNEFLPFAERELSWWDTNRTVVVSNNNKNYRLYQYRVATNCPRPENLLDDYYAGLHSTSDGDAEFVWSSTASACESGLDFSARWFAPGIMNRTGMQTNIIVPVDVNVFMSRNFEIMSEFFDGLDNNKSKYYAKKASQLRNAIDIVLRDSTLGVWFDYDLKKKTLRRDFYPSNIFPLLLRDRRENDCFNAINYLDNIHIFDYKGGVPSSLFNKTREQWDFPNAWAPANHLLSMSLLKCENINVKWKAKKIADAFAITVYNGLFDPIPGIPAQVWEKYDVRFDNGISGFGGEYPVQAGFGWTNGAVLDFIQQFYTEKSSSMKIFDEDENVRIKRKGQIELNNKYSDIFHFGVNEMAFLPQKMNNLISIFDTLVIVLICIVIVIIFLFATASAKSIIRGSSLNNYFGNAANQDETLKLLHS